MVPEEIMNTSSESGSYYCQKMAVKLYRYMLKPIATTILRMGLKGLSR